jgi:hypothetical protein
MPSSVCRRRTEISSLAAATGALPCRATPTALSIPARIVTDPRARGARRLAAVLLVTAVDDARVGNPREGERPDRERNIWCSLLGFDLSGCRRYCCAANHPRKRRSRGGTAESRRRTTDRAATRGSPGGTAGPTPRSRAAAFPRAYAGAMLAACSIATPALPVESWSRSSSAPPAPTVSRLPGP